MELRAAPRFPITAHVSFSGHQLAGDGTIVNISSHGLMVETTWPVKPGRSLSLHVSLPDQEEPLGMQIADVRWSHDGRFGVRPVMMALTDWQRLHQFASHLQECALTRN